ncbi:MAG: hypothetical protein R3258_09210 [Acidimicrobiia bacterium]|nr:hypothetical protein [Acidimicrobiia bacterium]
MTSPPPLHKPRLVQSRDQPELWRRLIVAALIGMVVVHAIGTLAVRGEYPRFALIVEVPLLALAIWVATGARWAVPAATVITTLLVVYTVVGAGSRLTELEGSEILAAVLFFGFGVVAVVAGVATTAYSRRAP